MELIGNIFLILGLFFIVLGTYAVNRFRNFYTRILIASKVDTVGFLFVILGLIAKSGASFFSAKLTVILFFYLITNPISSHSILHSAYHNGFRIKKEESK